MSRFSHSSESTSLWIRRSCIVPRRSAVMMLSLISSRRRLACRGRFTISWNWSSVSGPSWPAFACPGQSSRVLFMIWIAAIIIFCFDSFLLIRGTYLIICFRETLTLGRLWSLSSFFVSRPIQTKISICSHFILCGKMFGLLDSYSMHFFYLFE